MVQIPQVERRVKKSLVVEITIAPVDRQLGRWNGDEECARPALDRLMARAWRDDDDLVAEARRGCQLRLGVGPDSAAELIVEGGNIDDAHRRGKAGPCR